MERRCYLLAGPEISERGNRDGLLVQDHDEVPGEQHLGLLVLTPTYGSVWTNHRQVRAH